MKESSSKYNDDDDNLWLKYYDAEECEIDEDFAAPSGISENIEDADIDIASDRKPGYMFKTATPEEEDEESDECMGFGLFDDDLELDNCHTEEKFTELSKSRHQNIHKGLPAISQRHAVIQHHLLNPLNYQATRKNPYRNIRQLPQAIPQLLPAIPQLLPAIPQLLPAILLHHLHRPLNLLNYY